MGELTGEIYAQIDGMQELVVYCWPISHKGRKAQGGTAITTADGKLKTNYDCTEFGFKHATISLQCLACCTYIALILWVDQDDPNARSIAVYTRHAFDSQNVWSIGVSLLQIKRC